jgi:hypothetical protein
VPRKHCALQNHSKARSRFDPRLAGASQFFPIPTRAFSIPTLTLAWILSRSSLAPQEIRQTSRGVLTNVRNPLSKLGLTLTEIKAQLICGQKVWPAP